MRVKLIHRWYLHDTPVEYPTRHKTFRFFQLHSSRFTCRKKNNLLLFALLLRLEWSYRSVQFSSCENPELCTFNMFFFTPLKTRQWTRRQLNNDLVCPSRLNCLLLLCVILLKSHHPSYSIFSLFSSLEFMFRKSLLMHMGCSTKLSHHFLPKWRYIKISATMWD